MRSTLLCVIGLALVAGSAHAQPASKPNQQQLDEARAHFKAAEAAKAGGDFNTAAVEYLAAYERFQDPEFFFNVAEVYRLANDEPTALMYYQKYLELEPNGRGAAAARTASDELRKSIAQKEDAAKREAKPKPVPAATQTADEVQPETEPVDEPEVDPGSPGRGTRIAGLATAGAGVVAIGVGVAFGLRARSISNEVARWDTFDQSRFEAGHAAERNMFVCAGVGGAALVAGGVLYYLGYRASIVPTRDGVVATAHF